MAILGIYSLDFWSVSAMYPAYSSNKLIIDFTKDPSSDCDFPSQILSSFNTDFSNLHRNRFVQRCIHKGRQISKGGWQTQSH